MGSRPGSFLARPAGTLGEEEVPGPHDAPRTVPQVEAPRDLPAANGLPAVPAELLGVEAPGERSGREVKQAVDGRSRDSWAGPTAHVDDSVAARCRGAPRSQRRPARVFDTPTPRAVGRRSL